MEQATQPQEICRKCGGALVEEEDYIAAQMVRRALAAIPVAIVICAVWGPLFSLIRIAVGGGFSRIEGSAAAFIVLLILRKIVVAVAVGLLLGMGVGIWRSGWGLFTGVVVGSLAGFFFGASYAMPYDSGAAYRWDIVVTAVLCGILGGVTAVLTDAVSAKRFAGYIGPDITVEPAPGAEKK